jgi:hypothetical protein
MIMVMSLQGEVGMVMRIHKYFVCIRGWIHLCTHRSIMRAQGKQNWHVTLEWLCVKRRSHVQNGL